MMMILALYEQSCLWKAWWKFLLQTDCLKCWHPLSPDVATQSDQVWYLLCYTRCLEVAAVVECNIHRSNLFFLFGDDSLHSFQSLNVNMGEIFDREWMKLVGEGSLSSESYTNLMLQVLSSNCLFVMRTSGLYELALISVTLI